MCLNIQNYYEKIVLWLSINIDGLLDLVRGLYLQLTPSVTEKGKLFS